MVDKKTLFIGFEGADGSGKGTQFALARDRLRREGFSVGELDFPQYGRKSAVFVERYLNGAYGTDVDGFRGTVFYALDRFDAFFNQEEGPSLIDRFHEHDFWLTNRYVTSNMGHQAGKAQSPEERERILKFIEHLEYDVLALPKPDDVFFLYVHPITAQRLVDQKEERTYTTKKRDLHEADINHLRQAVDSYRYVAQREGWTTIDCMVPDSDPHDDISTCVRSINDIHEEIYAHILRKIS